MNAVPIRLVSLELDEQDRIAESYEQRRDREIAASKTRATASLASAVADYEARWGKPFRDPEPTAEEIAAARAKADSAMRGLIGLLPLTEEERAFVQGVKP